MLVLSSVTMLQSNHIFSYVVLFGFVSSYYLNTSLQERIPIYLQEICPGSGVCLNDIIDPDNDLPSCCGVCSCSADCEVDGRCCFHDQNNDTIANTRSTREYNECLFPITTQEIDVFALGLYQSYYMISSTATDKISDGMDKIMVASCGDVKVAPWGSMYPVYSKQTGKIYKNIACADAHNITDGELWTVYVLCEKMPNVAFDSSLQSGSIPDYCIVQFFYEGEMSLLKSENCYHGEKYNAKCLDSFEIPASLSLSREEIVASCEGGLLSPYKNIFANVFCFLCGSSKAVALREQDICMGDNGYNVYERSGRTTFTMIFDASAFSDIVQPDHVGNGRVACPRKSAEQKGGGCRAIFCPQGQTYSQAKGCFYPGNKWYVNRFCIAIDLFSEKIINISTLYSSVQNLQSSWPNKWTINDVSYESSAVPMQTSHIFVTQYIELYSPFNPKSFISSVKNHISKSWHLKTNNETIQLRAKIARTYYLNTQEYILLYRNPNVQFRLNQCSVISKLYFCDHVILLPSEYSIIRSIYYKTLINRITNKTLLRGEYEIGDNENVVVAEVCLEDSGFYRVALSNSIKISPQVVFVQCLAIIYMTKIF